MDSPWFQPAFLTGFMIIVPAHPLINFLIWLVVTGTMEFWMTFHSVGNGKSSQLTLTPSFFRGVGLNHQPVINERSPVTARWCPLWTSPRSLCLCGGPPISSTPHRQVRVSDASHRFLLLRWEHELEKNNAWSFNPTKKTISIVEKFAGVLDSYSNVSINVYSYDLWCS